MKFILVFLNGCISGFIIGLCILVLTITLGFSLHFLYNQFIFGWNLIK